MKKEKVLTKKFLGKTEFPKLEQPENSEKSKKKRSIAKEERLFEKKHLKAYLRGDTRFCYRVDPKTKEPIWFDVLYKHEMIN
ncbi:MAG: hypothetical protein H8E98_03060 [Bacteroidetes bacterium]|nr:hypothetical protein [Bacteroidota bacterium]